MKKLLAAVLTVTILSLGGTTAFAAEQMANGVQTEVTAGQESYSEKDTAKVKVKVTNHSGKNITGLRVEQIAGVGIEIVRGKSVLAENEKLADSESKEFDIEVKKSNSAQGDVSKENLEKNLDNNSQGPNQTNMSNQQTDEQAGMKVGSNATDARDREKAAKTGDKTDKRVVIIIGCLTVAACLYTGVRKKKTREMFALILCGAMISQCISVTVRGEEKQNGNSTNTNRTLEYEVTEVVHIGENEYEVTAKITFYEQVETIENYVPQTYSGKNYPENIVFKSPLIDTQKNNHFVFIGNSLLGVGESHKAFKTIGTNYGKQMDTNGIYFYGKSLSGAKEAIDDEETYGYQDDVNGADVIVFQEYGGAYHTTVDDIKAFMRDYKNENTVYYYYTSQYDIDLEGFEDLADDEDFRYLFYLKELENMGVHVLSTNALIEELQAEFEETQGYQNLIIQADGVHPTIFLGYCTSLYMFSKIYKVSAENVALSSMGEEFYELLPGDTKEEKTANYQKVITMIDAIGR